MEKYYLKMKEEYEEKRDEEFRLCCITNELLNELNECI